MGRSVIRPKVKTGKVGRPSGILRYIIQWAIDTAFDVQSQQLTKDRVASGGSLASWEVDVRDANSLNLNAADYYSFIIKEKTPMGRGPTGQGGSGIVGRAIRHWVAQKGIRPSHGTLDQLIFAITKTIHEFGTTLFRTKETSTAVSIEEAISRASESTKLDKIAEEIAMEGAENLLKRFTKNPNFKVK